MTGNELGASPRGLAALDRTAALELVPVLRRCSALDPEGLARVRVVGQTLRLLIRLPFEVLAARAIELSAPAPALDVTVGIAALQNWLDDPGAAVPQLRDGEWRGGSPPETGWQRVDTVPDDVVRGLVRQGALTLKEHAAREGVAAAQPRAEIADALLDSVVLTVTDDAAHATAALNLRTLSALTRLGFLPRGSHIAVDIAGRWTRVAAAYGSVYAERPGLGLGVLRP